jgi:hypothetical protein
VSPACCLLEQVPELGLPDPENEAGAIYLLPAGAGTSARFPPDPENEAACHLPVACWSRYRSQVLPDPESEAGCHLPVACWSRYRSQVLPDPESEAGCHLPVACWSRYRSQVLPDPGKEARATRGPGAALRPRGEHQEMLGPCLRTLTCRKQLISSSDLYILHP